MAKELRRTPKTAFTTAAPKIGASSKTVTKSRTKTMPTEDQIRARAFEIYLARNGGPGDAHADWLQAERELMEDRSR